MQRAGRRWLRAGRGCAPQAIDRAAMKAGLSGTDDYLGEWRRETVQAEDAQALATRIETEYDTARLRDLIASGGRKD